MRKRILSLFSSVARQKPTRLRNKSKAQSLVEFAIALPILMLLLSGVVEFGFALNYYLSLLDATRESARYHANLDPFVRDATGNIIGDNVNFYNSAIGMAYANLDPTIFDPAFTGRKILLDPAEDEIFVTVYAKDSTSIVSYPASGPFRAFNNTALDSLFTSSEIESRFESGSPNAGILVVEVHYNYHQVMALPWLSAFVPDPLLLRAYTVMPLVAAEP
jgi:Flp pilus assembly protein TadG